MPHTRHEMQRRPRGATRLSHPSTTATYRSSRFFRLACVSLLFGVMAVLSSGCVIAGPPDYQDPQKTPPVLDLTGASPSIWSVIVANSGAISGQPATQLQISVPVRSEDGTDSLIGLLYVDYNTDKQVLQPGYWPGGSSTFDIIRNVSLPWSAANQPKGCHTLTLLVTHASNVGPGAVVSIPKDQPDDLALATWWVDIDDTNSDTTLPSCPKPSSP